MNNRQKQKGMATIIVAILILVILTVMALFSARIGVFDQRIAANDVRYKEAFAIAEAGLDMTAEKFEAEFARTYTGTGSLATIAASSVFSNTKSDGSTAGANEALFNSTIASGASSTAIPIYTVTSTGTSADTTAGARLQRQFTMINVFGGAVPDIPVIVGGAVGTGGNFNVVGNPNGGASGAPVSVWSSGSITASSSSATCHLEFYDGNNAQCSNPSGNSENISRGTNPATAITSYDATYPDLLPNDPNFPPDIFNFMFGLTSSDWAVKYAEAQSQGQVVSDCSSIVTLGANAGLNYPLWWVTGDCTMNGGTIGSLSNPVIIVIDDHSFKASGNTQVYGIIYLFDNPDNPYASSTSPTAQMSGTMEIAGSFVSDVGGAAMSGSYSVKYEPNVITSFQNNGNSYSFAWVPGSWRDF